MRGGQAVKGQSFNSWRNVGQVRMTVRVHQARQVDELAILDITGSLPDLALVRALGNDCFFPVAFGGGITRVDHGIALLSSGADKVIINTAAANSEAGLVEGLSTKLGNQSVMVSIDVKDGTVWTHSGTHNTGLSPVRYAQSVESRGAGEILLTDIVRDGTLGGYNLPLIAEVSAAVSIPVVAAGGAGTYRHLAEAYDAGAHAVAAGAMWCFTDQTPGEAAEYLAARGYNVRNTRHQWTLTATQTQQHKLSHSSENTGTCI